ncbi:MAG: DUF3570 domain-containing protein [Bacteroidales bacterium]|nr:DUF3570 domain-containing protein [Bacteroidales bacterium]
MKYFLLIITLAFSIQAFSQSEPIKVLDEKEVNFMFNYYEQDGNHSPVTGGIGSEKLECVAPQTSINIPFDTVHNISVTLGIDHYTSASCDQIDRFITAASSEYLSSASSKDTRVHCDVSYTYHNPLSNNEKGFMLGYSKEFDVVSLATGINYAISSEDENRQLILKASAYYDTWKLMYPGEIRDGDEYRYGNESDDYDLDTRTTATFTATYSQVLTRNLQVLFTADYVMQRGILHSPFHRVYFNDPLVIIDPDTNSTLAWKTMRAENLPRARNKFPMAMRVSYFVNDFIITRFYYRYYFDDFDMTGHTFSMEIPVKLSSWLSVYPFFRYHEQTASKYFAPFAEHPVDAMWNPTEEFYTSDYDVSALTSRKYGGGFRISPIYGIANMKTKNNTITFKSLEARYAQYNRSDGLEAWYISFGMSFVF